MRALFLGNEESLPHITEKNDQGWTLNTLANAYSLNGQPHNAMTLYELGIRIAEDLDRKKNLAIGIGAIAKVVYLPTGALRMADTNLHRKIEILRENHEQFHEAVGHQDLAHLLTYCGMWDIAENEFEEAFRLFKVVQASNDWNSKNWALKSKLALFQRDTTRALDYSKKALELSELQAKELYPLERDFVTSYWLLGTAYCIDGQLDLAEQHLNEALIRCRGMNNVEQEADVLLNLAHLRYDQRKYEEAKSLADEALLITERCGYVLQGADVNLFLAQYTLEQEKDKVKAKAYAETALKLAYCDGPPYYYKVAYHEAERFLENLE